MTKFFTLPSFFSQPVLFVAMLGAFGTYAQASNVATPTSDTDGRDLLFLGNVYYENQEADFKAGTRYQQGNVKSEAKGTSFHNLTDIAIAKGSKVEILTRRLDDLLSFGLTGYLINTPGMQQNTPEAYAVGAYSHARSGSIEIGSHILSAKDNQGAYLFGDVAIGDTTIKELHQDGVAQTTVGTNSYTNGSFAVNYGAYNVLSSKFNKDNEGFFTTTTDLINMGAAQNALATVNGSLNAISSQTAKSHYSGIANVISGSANTLQDTNGTMVIGSGNDVKNSSQDMTKFAHVILNSDASDSREDVNGGKHVSVRDKQIKLIKAMQDGEVGAGIMLFGNANALDNVQRSSVVGFRNTLKDVTDTVLLGNNRKLEGTDGSIFLGSADGTLTSNVDRAVAIGYGANVEVDDGIALGSYAVSKKLADDEKSGWDFLNQQHSRDQSATWTATHGAFSIGSDRHTRRISGVAAGSQDTDAVNVAQLKAATLVVTANGSTDPKTLSGSGHQNLMIKQTSDTETGAIHYDLSLSDHLQLGEAQNADGTKAPNVDIDGTQGTVTVGADATKQISMNGKDGTLTVGGADGIKMAADTKTVTGLGNTQWGGTYQPQADRAATEGQLQIVDQHLKTVESNLASTNTQVNKLKTKVNDLSTQVTDINNNVNGLKDRVGKVETALTSMDNDLADLKNYHWTAEGGALTGSSGKYVDSTSSADAKTITSGKTVTLSAGDNLTLTQNGAEFTYALNKDLNVDSLTFTKDGKEASFSMTDEGVLNLKGTKEQRLLVNGKATATLEDGVHYVADQGKASVELNKNISFTGGATEVSTHDNIGVIGSSDASGNGILNIRLAKDINLGEGGSFTAGGVKVDGATNTVTGLSNTKWNLDQVVDSRAATEGQLRDLANTLKSTDNTAKLRELERDVNRMDTNIRDAGATAAALAGLKPIQYDPEKTTQAYGAVGAYRGREAIAFGLGHYLNQDMLIHAGIGIGAHKMANAGFSMKFGFGGEEKVSALNTYQTSPMKAVYQIEGEMKALQAKNRWLNERNEALDSRNAEIDRANAKLMANNEEMEKKLQRMAQQLDALEKKMAHKKP